MSTQPKPLPPIEFLRECFEYYPETGELFWKERPRKHFPTERGWKIFNSRWAHTQAATVVNNRGYLNGDVSYEGTHIKFLAHRLIWKLTTGHDPVKEIDHINGNPTDNTLENLREADGSQNNFNRFNCPPNRTGYKGVLEKQTKSRGKTYSALIRVYGKRYYLGTFDTPEEAHAAYVEAANKYHKEFANAR